MNGPESEWGMAWDFGVALGALLIVIGLIAVAAS
jgi:hypothetical protein